MTVQLNPEDYEAWGSLGFICLRTSRRDEARHYLERALRLNPEDAIARANWEELQSRLP
jgi:Flp pilus assembly protein TadD